jgi:hypothetical protein
MYGGNSNFSGESAMTRLVVDDSVVQDFKHATGCLEICDRSGQVLGYFAPADPTIYRELHSRLSEEELQAREQEPGGRPLAEILRDLENRS